MADQQLAPDRRVTRLRGIDWDFAGQYSESPFSRLHWHPGRLASQVAAALVGVLSEPGDVVLDPFMGSGTVLVEAQRLLRRPIGVDLNPVAEIITASKTLGVSAVEIARAVAAIRTRWAQVLSTPAYRTVVPPTVQSDKWYAPSVLHELSILWQLISELADPERSIALGAFSSILLPVCRETRHWGYVCDNTTPRSDFAGDVRQEFGKSLVKILRAYEERDAELQRRCRNDGRVLVTPASIIRGDAHTTLATFESCSIDMVLTSPPYFGVSDYVKSQRLTMEWLGLEIEPFRLAEVGARSKRHRRSASEEFTSYFESLSVEIHRILRPKGVCAIVIGESRTRESLMASVMKATASAGLVPLFLATRRVSQQRRQLPSVVSEEIIVLERH